MRKIHIMDVYSIAREFFEDNFQYTDFSLSYTQEADKATYVEYDALDLYERKVILFALISNEDYTIRAGVRMPQGHIDYYFQKLLHEDRSWTVPTGRKFKHKMKV